MPYRRHTSPVTLEVYQPPASETDYDEIGASDDDLDETARGAKRRRIEALAAAYLRDSPPLILSASLKGPFDKGWVNPWRKDRRRKENQSENHVDAPSELAVQGTGTRPRPRKRDARGRSCAAKNESQPAPAAAAAAAASPSQKLSVRQRSPSKPKPRDVRSTFSPRSEHVQVPVSTGCGLRRTIPRAEETPLGSTVDQRADCGWLKTDHARTNFKATEPPTSPTTNVSQRQQVAKKGGRSSSDRRPISDPRVALSALSVRKAREHAKFQLDSQSSAPGANLSAAIFQPAELQPEFSFRVATSCSQLPKFEYRLRKPHESERQIWSASPKLTDSEIRCDPPVSLDQAVDPAGISLAVPPPVPASPPTGPSAAVPNGVEEPKVDSLRQPSAHTSKTQTEQRSSGVDGTITGRGAEEIASEGLPSGQAVPGNPILSDYMSLHSTALPKDDGGHGGTIRDPQLSTQGALLLAHRSFQDGLTSPDLARVAPSRGAEAIAEAPTSQSPEFTEIRPFREIATPSPSRLDGGLADRKRRYQMMSTQCIADAVTPFTFSPTKKRSHYAKETTQATPCRGQTAAQASLSLQLRNDNQSQMSPSSQLHEQLDYVNDAQPQQAPLPHHDTETQLSTLPFTLTGESPATGQNGQGGLNALDSFNLSQAIADAGSWLRQSFDFSKDLQQCGEKAAASSTDMGRSAIGLHPL